MTPKKRRKVKTRWREEPDEEQSFLKRYGLLAGIVAVAVVLVAGLALVNRGGVEPSTPDQISMDKSKGPAEAPVVVVEYGDFQ